MSEMNYYYRSIPSEEMSDFEPFYRTIASKLPAHAWCAELGVADGRSVILLASLMSYHGKPCTIWAVENFSYGGDNQRRDFDRNLKNSGEDTIVLMDMETLVGACRCQDEQFDFVFVDSSHLYENTKAEIRLWMDKIKMGGVLAGHDYSDNPQVKQAVDEMIPADHLKIVETEHGHGVWWVERTPFLKLNK
jgi:hypothetical protein